MKHDLIVVGDGIFGCVGAFEAARRGRSVAIADRQPEPLHQRCSSKGESRTWRPPFEAPHYDPINGPALSAWKGLERQLSAELIVDANGGLEFGDAESAGWQALPGELTAHDVRFEKIPRTAFPDLYPGLNIIGDADYAIHRDDVRIIRAAEARRMLYEAARPVRYGGFDVTEIESTDSSVTIHLKNVETGNRQSVEGEFLLLAAGGGTPGLLSQLGFEVPFKLTNEQFSLFDMSVRAGTEVLPPATYQANADDGGVYIVPDLGGGVKIGRRCGGPETDTLSGSDSVDQNAESRCRVVAEALFGPKTVRSARSVRGVYEWSTRDYRPFAGVVPQHPRIATIALFTGGGFKFAPVLGSEVIRQLFGESSQLDIDRYSLARLSAS